MSEEVPPLPTFAIIGAQKSATRWLRMNLGEHPEIFTAPRELAYFNNPRRIATLGPAWYREQFAGWAGEPVVGEATPGYMMLRHHPGAVARRIDRTLPDVRLIAILRDPIERAQSAFAHHIARGRLRDDAELIPLVRRCHPRQDRLGLVAGGWYAKSLAPFIRRFGERVLVLFHDDLAEDPAELYEAALRHLGVDPSFRPPKLDRVRFSGRGEQSGPELDDQDRAELWWHFRRDVRRLERMTGRDLARWRPTPSRVSTK